MKKSLITFLFAIFAVTLWAQTYQNFRQPGRSRIRPVDVSGGGGGGTTTVGNTFIGGSSYAGGLGFQTWGPKFTAPRTGTVTTIYIYSSNTNAACQVKVGLFQDSSGTPVTVVSGSPATSTPGTYTAQWKAYTCSIPVTSGTVYWISYATDIASSFTGYRNTGASGSSYYNNTGVGGGTWASSPGVGADTADVSVKADIL